MSLTFLYSLLIIMYVFCNQHLTSSMALNEENVEDNILNVENQSEPLYLTKWVLGKDSQYHECSTNESLVDAEDILTLIDYIFDREGYKNVIKSNYSEHAQQVANYHLEEVNKIEELIHNPTAHLNYTLGELAEINNSTMDPLLEQVQNELGEKPQLENKYEMRVMDLQMSMHTLKEFKVVCRHHCRRRKSHQDRKIKYGRSFCVNINDLHEDINSKLTVIVEDLKEFAHSLINKHDKKLSKKENSLRRKLEKGFLGKSGKTVIHIFKIQNEHERLLHNLAQITNGTITIEELGNNIDNKSLDLRNRIEDFGEFCLTCDLNLLVQEPVKTVSPIDATVNALIRIKYERVWNAIQTHVKLYFVDLFLKLKKLKKIKSIKNQYSLTREEEAELSYDAKMVLDHLEEVGPLSGTKRLVEVVKTANVLLRRIEIKLIKAYKL